MALVKRLKTSASVQPVLQPDYEALGTSTKHAYYDGSILPELIEKYQRLVDTASDAGTLKTRHQHINVVTPRIAEWLKAKERIGADSNNGIAVLAGFPDPAWSDLIVVKTIPDAIASKDPYAINDLIHELLVARFLMNLRPLIPTFVLPLGAFLCNSMRTPAKGQPVPDFCTDTGGRPQTPYILLEKIVTNPAGPVGSMTLSVYDYIQQHNKVPLWSTQHTTTGMHVLAIIFQVMCGLGLAQEHYGFAHFDLHTNNVLLRGLTEMGNVRKIVMPLMDTDYEVDFNKGTDGYVPVVIDFGMSYISFTDKLGVVRWDATKTRNKFLLRPSLWHDAFRFIAACCLAFTASWDDMPGPIHFLYEWLSQHEYLNPLTNKKVPLFGDQWVIAGGIQAVPQKLSYYNEYMDLYDKLSYLQEVDVVHAQSGEPLTPWSAAKFIQSIGEQYSHWYIAPLSTRQSWEPSKIFVPIL